MPRPCAPRRATPRRPLLHALSPASKPSGTTNPPTTVTATSPLQPHCEEDSETRHLRFLTLTAPRSASVWPPKPLSSRSPVASRLTNPASRPGCGPALPCSLLYLLKELPLTPETYFCVDTRTLSSRRDCGPGVSRPAPQALFQRAFCAEYLPGRWSRPGAHRRASRPTPVTSDGLVKMLDLRFQHPASPGRSQTSLSEGAEGQAMPYCSRNTALRACTLSAVA